MVPIPARIAAGIDKIAGPRKRTAFVVGVLEREMRRREQLEALEQAAGAWTEANHPELANGAEVWVREMRDASVKRLQELERDEDAE
jgi:hypothetical protein